METDGGEEKGVHGPSSLPPRDRVMAAVVQG